MRKHQKVFKKELGLIKDPNVLGFTELMLRELPKYFYKIPASSTGKYHPDYAWGDGGLVRHVRAAVYIATELFRMEKYSFSQHKQDLIISALLLHDGRKHGDGKTSFTVPDHPIQQAEAMDKNTIARDFINIFDYWFVRGLVMSHMGQWNLDRKKKPIMPKPRTRAQELVHLCDYIASRKMLEMNFEKYDKE